MYHSVSGGFKRKEWYILKAFKEIFISNPTGKMTGIPTITTSMMCNPICAERSKDPESVCSHCYASRGLKIYKAAREHYKDNTEILFSHELLPHEMPILNAKIVRFESHGDLVNTTHAKNYIRIAYANPWATIAIWTKNAAIMNIAIKELGKPDNLICVLSSDRLNIPTEEYKRFPWVNKVFTVYDKSYIDKHSVNINCGAKSCMSCRKCYTKDDPDFFINEKLK